MKNTAKKATFSICGEGKDRSKIGRKSRRKGHSFERYVAQLFRRWFPDARRGLQYRDGKECCDVEGTPYWIECKRRKHIGLFGMLKWWNKKGEINGRPMILICKGDNQPITATFSETLFFRGLATITWDWPQFKEIMDNRYLRAVPTAPTKEEV